MFSLSYCITFLYLIHSSHHHLAYYHFVWLLFAFIFVYCHSVEDPDVVLDFEEIVRRLLFWFRFWRYHLFLHFVCWRYSTFFVHTRGLWRWARCIEVVEFSSECKLFCIHFTRTLDSNILSFIVIFTVIVTVNNKWMFKVFFRPFLWIFLWFYISNDWSLEISSITNFGTNIFTTKELKLWNENLFKVFQFWNEPKASICS